MSVYTCIWVLLDCISYMYRYARDSESILCAFLLRISLNEQKAALGGSIAELLGNLPYIRASGMRPQEEKRLNAVAEQLRVTEFRHHKYMMGFHGSKDLIEGIGFAVVVGTAIQLALVGEVSSGAILTLAMLYNKAAQPLAKMHQVVDQGHEAVVKIGALSAVRALEIDPGLRGSVMPHDAAGTPLRAHALDVWVGGVGHTSSEEGKLNGSGSEAGTQAVHVLQGLSLEIERGTVVGVAGGSGSGKSTLLKSVLGLVPDYAGNLQIFEVEARDVHKAALAQKVAYAQQDPFVLTGTLRDNLVLAQPTAVLAMNGLASQPEVPPFDDTELLRALEQACLGPADHAWADGLETLIHEGGRNLSGGQRQRLALARVFLQRHAELIVLDEATSALDNTVEARVIEELHRHARTNGRTVVMVAHRLTTLRRTDRVLVMETGQIVQDGTFDDLAATRGVFQTLLRATDTDYEAKAPPQRVN